MFARCSAAESRTEEGGGGSVFGRMMPDVDEGDEDGD